MDSGLLVALGSIWGGSTALVVGSFHVRYSERAPRVALAIWSIKTEFGLWGNNEGSERVYPVRRDLGARPGESWEVRADLRHKRAPVSGSRAVPAFQVPVLHSATPPADEAVWKQMAHARTGGVSGRHRA